MNVKVLLMFTLIIASTLIEVESFEFVRNAVHKVVHKVHNVIHPNHKHTHHCKHEHDEEVEETTTTTSKPYIDIRANFEEETPTTLSPEKKAEIARLLGPEPDDINSRTIINVPCGQNTRSINGECRPVFK